jgi:hypothetical protein
MTAPLVFNSGIAYFIDGDAVPTPTQITILQSLSLDFKATIKKLYSQNILPVAAGRSQIDVTGKAKFADYQPRFIRDFFGSTMATGQTEVAVNENHAVPSAASFTVAPTNSGTFVQDLGVYYATTGVPLMAVSAAPALGQYVPATSASAHYTFASADANASVNINYDWTGTGGDTVTISNTSAGAANAFKSVLGGSYQGQQTNFILNACIPNSLKILDSKIGDFSMPEFDFDCIADSSGNLGTVSVAQTS